MKEKTHILITGIIGGIFACYVGYIIYVNSPFYNPEILPPGILILILISVVLYAPYAFWKRQYREKQKERFAGMKDIPISERRKLLYGPEHRKRVKLVFVIVIALTALAALTELISALSASYRFSGFEITPNLDGFYICSIGLICFLVMFYYYRSHLEKNF